MIVCSCNVLTDSKIRATLSGELCPKTPGAIHKCLGCSRNCGRCASTLKSIISEALAKVDSSGGSCDATACAANIALAD